MENTRAVKANNKFVWKNCYCTSGSFNKILPQKFVDSASTGRVFLRAMEKLGVSPQECLIIEDSTNGGRAAKAAGAKCVWYHNPDSGDQNIPYAELEIGEWNAENVNKLIQIMKEN